MHTQTIHFETANIKTALRLEIELRLCQRGEEKKCKFRTTQKKAFPKNTGEGENFKQLPSRNTQVSSPN